MGPVGLAVVALVSAGAVLGAAPAASADASAPPPYISQVVWGSDGGQPTLRVYPTAAGREVAGSMAKTAAQTDEAWGEVLSLAPDAGTAGMRAQFLCHWNYAEFAQPGKRSWDLEPWRAPVDQSVMLAAGCNP